MDDVIFTGAFGVAQEHPPHDQRVITTTRSHMTDAVSQAINACEPTNVLQVGGAGHKVYGIYSTVYISMH